MIDLLLEMMMYKRPHDSWSEKEFIERFIMPFNPKQDGYGNLWVFIGERPLLWCSHVDTVHNDAGKQKIIVKDNIISAVNSKCLGADDGAGVWIMLFLMRHQVEGTYCFHRCEERGGKGSAWIRDNYRLTDYKWSIALDRKGYDNIVTHQRAKTKCASEEFANVLAESLEGYKPDPTGSFTDNYNYREQIPENVNLSVGYFNQHRSSETLDIEHLVWLAQTLSEIKFEDFPCERDPSKVEYSHYQYRKPSNPIGGYYLPKTNFPDMTKHTVGQEEPDDDFGFNKHICATKDLFDQKTKEEDDRDDEVTEFDTIEDYQEHMERWWGFNEVDEDKEKKEKEESERIPDEFFGLGDPDW